LTCLPVFAIIKNSREKWDNLPFRHRAARMTDSGGFHMAEERGGAGRTSEDKSYIRTNAEYYETAFRKLRGQYGRTSWNWASFCFPTGWFFYRKMFVWGLSAIAVTSAVCLFGGVLTAVLALFFRCLTGLYGNFLYLLHVEDITRGGRRLREPAKTRYVYLRGGTSAVLAGLGLAVLTVIEGLIIHYFYA
jgi:hypothetical protein